MSSHDLDRSDGGAVTDATAAVTDAWVRASAHFANSVLEANRATLAAFGLSDDERERAGGTESVAYEEDSWETERSVETPSAIGVGDTVRFSKRLTDDDVRAFAAASGDTNRLHLDDEFAADTRFGGRIVHGTLVAGLLSAALARLPGLTIYLSQDLRFTGPVDVGDRVTAVVEVTEDLGDGRYRLSTEVLGADDDPCVEGEAVVLVDELPGRGRSATAAE